jgi:hypothetical protein
MLLMLRIVIILQNIISEVLYNRLNGKSLHGLKGYAPPPPPKYVAGIYDQCSKIIR